MRTLVLMFLTVAPIHKLPQERPLQHKPAITRPTTPRLVLPPIVLPLGDMSRTVVAV
jgi:hypothetical protein